MPLPQM